jgi:hypothetical protein
MPVPLDEAVLLTEAKTVAEALLRHMPKKVYAFYHRQEQSESVYHQGLVLNGQVHSGQNVVWSLSLFFAEFPPYTSSAKD